MSFFNKARVAATSSGASVLGLLRTMPQEVCASRGFICRGDVLTGNLGGSCGLSCNFANGAYQIDVTAGGTDYFIPFQQGAASYCDVPRGVRDGTLVVTFPMNGCALEVCDNGDGKNRFFHDSDGRSMPGQRRAKCRIDADMYEGPGSPARSRYASLINPYAESGFVGGGYEHTLVCVKKGRLWNVYQTATVTLMDAGNAALKRYVKVTGGTPVHLGVFED